MRQIVLDTETTGLDPREGHRIIEIGAVELIDRRLTGRQYQQFLQPDREIEEGALEVHGITQEFLADKPRFADVAGQLLAFIEGAELIIHNAPFDVGFLNHELLCLGLGTLEQRCVVFDTLTLARQLHPSQKNSLDALCKRYRVDNSRRERHGALLDAEILADVYLAMTGGQSSLRLDEGAAAEPGVAQSTQESTHRLSVDRPALRVVTASDEELRRHDALLSRIDAKCGNAVVWRRIADEGPV